MEGEAGVLQEWIEALAVQGRRKYVFERSDRLTLLMEMNSTLIS